MAGPETPYARLYFVRCVDDNKSMMFDAFFGNLREVDIIFGFHYADLLLDGIINHIQSTREKRKSSGSRGSRSSSKQTNAEPSSELRSECV
jgi:hypothetical protein